MIKMDRTYVDAKKRQSEIAHQRMLELFNNLYGPDTGPKKLEEMINRFGDHKVHVAKAR